jgi:hypothetical protein
VDGGRQRRRRAAVRSTPIARPPHGAAVVGRRDRRDAPVTG